MNVEALISDLTNTFYFFAQPKRRAKSQTQFNELAMDQGDQMNFFKVAQNADKRIFCRRYCINLTVFVKKVHTHQNFCNFCNATFVILKTVQSKQSTKGQKCHPIWSPCNGPTMYYANGE
jgi:hypothetical protein